MALRRKGSRTITVDNESYRWRVRPRPTYTQALAASGLVVAVERERGGSRMTVEFSAPRPDSWCGVDAVVVTPKDVARFIRAAIERGWVPAENGSTFVLRADEVI